MRNVLLNNILFIISLQPLMLKYQQDLKEQLLKLINEADEELVDLVCSL